MFQSFLALPEELGQYLVPHALSEHGHRPAREAHVLCHEDVMFYMGV